MVGKCKHQIENLVFIVNSRTALLLVIPCLVLPPLSVTAQEHIERVVGVSDGDTLTILDDRKQKSKYHRLR